MTKAVLFDWSGTLFNDYKDVSGALRKSLIDPQISRKLFFHSFIKPFKYLLSSLNFHFPNFFERNYPIAKLESGLVKSTEEVMRFLKERGIIVGIFSTQSERFIHKVLKDSNLEKYVDYVEGGIFDKAPRVSNFIRKHDLRENEAFYLSDLLEDLKEVRKTGVRICAVSWGYDDEEKLKLAKPDSIISKLEELKNLI